MAKPKLALIPASQGSELFSVLPSSGVGDFDFSRSGRATRINSQGLIEEVANGQSRLNYPMIDGKVVGCPHHILEPERRNYIQYSEDFSQYSDVSGADIFSNTTISPDGTLNASRVGFGGSEFSRIFINTSTSSNTYTFTLYAKSDTSKKFRFRISDTSGTQYSEDFVTTSKWQRFSYEFIGDPSTCAICNSSDAISGSIDIFGFQLENGSYPTSYIKTNGEINGVTRSSETANGSGDSATFNDSEGVLMAEISGLTEVGTNQSIAISNGTQSNRILFRYNSTNQVRVIVVSSNAFVFDKTLNISSIEEYNKFVIKYKQDDFALWVNGFELGADNSGVTPTGLNELALDDGSGVNDFYGKTKQLQYYNSALTDSELEKISSWTSFTDMAQGQLYTIE